MAPLDPALLQAAVDASPLLADHAVTVDRESAYERLVARVAPPAPSPAAQPEPRPKSQPEPEQRPQQESGDGGGGASSGLPSSPVKSFTCSAASAAGREITRSLFGTARRSRPHRRSSGGW